MRNIKLYFEDIVEFFIKENNVDFYDYDQKLKVRLVLKLCFLFTIFTIPVLPTVYLISPILLGIFILLISVNIGVPFIIKHTTNLYFPTILLLLCNFIYIAAIHSLTGRPEGLAIVLWYIVIILSASFVLNRKWALFFSIIAFALIVGLTAIQHYDLLSYSNIRINDTQRLWTLPFRIGLPIFMIYVIAKEFVANRSMAVAEAQNLITHQTDLYEKMTTSEHFFRSILEEAEDIIYEIDSSGHFSYINPAGLKMTGYTKEEIYQMNFSDCILKVDRERHRRTIFKQIKQKQKTNFFQCRIRTKRGEIIWLGQTTKIIFDSQGNYQRSFCIARNITKQKEERLILNKAKEEAVRLNEAKNNFMATISHELRTPLNAIIALGHNLLETHPKVSQKEDLQTILFSSNNLLSLINDVLDFSLIEQSKLILKKEPFDLHYILSKTVKAYELQLGKEISLQLHLDERVPTKLIGDSGRLLQIVNNLVQNAIKFTKNGDISINVQLQSFKDNKPQIYFAVKDSGIGINASNLENIFNRFTQIETNLNRNYSGLGLGLSIVKKLLQRMDSQIYVESAVNKGSTFYFTLAFSEQQQPIIKKKEVLKNPQKDVLSEAKVLLVEDNKINQLVAKKLLKKWKTKIDLAENGQIAVEKAKVNHYDIILMDIEMPVMDGLEATKQIRCLDNYKNIPIIAVTASTTKETIAKLETLKFTDLIQKPFKPDTLFQTMVMQYNKPEAFSKVK